MKYLIAVCLMFTGCAISSKQVKVLTSQAPINVKNIELNDGDKLLCDPEGCRVLR